MDTFADKTSTSRMTDPDSNREQTRGEELANSVSHGIGFFAALIGTPYLVNDAIQRGDGAFVIGTIVFTATILILYLASTLYHALPPGSAKRVFRIIEHSAIYLLIAGTYTPFTLGVLRGAWGWSLFGIVWSLAVAGVFLKALGRVNHPTLSTGIYLLMGWVIVIAIHPLLSRVPIVGLLWMLAGGLAYTIGVVFFVTDWRYRYGHLVWHLFVMVGTGCHYIAVLRYAY